MKNQRSPLRLFLFAFIGWTWCGAIMVLGPAIFSMKTTLLVHAALGPLAFFVLAAVYGRRYPKPKPIGLAILMTLFVIVMDAGLVAPFFLGSTDMFASPLGTWIPFALIFFCAFVGGRMGAGSSR